MRVPTESETFDNEIIVPTLFQLFLKLVLGYVLVLRWQFPIISCMRSVQLGEITILQSASHDIFLAYNAHWKLLLC
jgi:hypothetical protein